MTHYPTRLIERSLSPASEPLSLSEVKSFLRIDGTEQDDLLNEMIASARLFAEEMTGKSLLTQRWKLAYDRHVPQEVALPFGPVQSILSVKVVDEDDNETSVATTSYHLNAAKNSVVFETALCGHRIEIEMETGFGSSAADVPATIRQGMLVHVAHLYEHRDAVSPPMVSHMLYAQHREVRI